MKTSIMHLAAILALILCIPPIAVAQFYGPTETPGMFGYRTMGGPMVARQTFSSFGYRTIGGPMTYVNSSGMFGLRTIGPPMGANIYGNFGAIRSGLGGYVPYSMLPGEYQVAFPNQTSSFDNIPPELAGFMPEPAGITQVVPNSSPERNAPVNMVPAGQNPALPAETEMQAASAPPAASNVTMSRPRIRVESVAPTRPQSFVRSQKLSDQLTMIARVKGMLAGENINVYLSNDVALVQGRVRSPADRALLANVLSLAPEVGQIDNRLAVGKTGD